MLHIPFFDRHSEPLGQKLVPHEEPLRGLELLSLDVDVVEVVLASGEYVVVEVE